MFAFVPPPRGLNKRDRHDIGDRTKPDKEGTGNAVFHAVNSVTDQNAASKCAPFEIFCSSTLYNIAGQ